MIRDLVFLVSMFGMLPVAFVAPHAGVLLWGWFAIMNPHREAWNVASLLRINLVIALVTIVAWFVSREPKRLPLDTTVILLLIFGGWITLSTLMAVNPPTAWHLWGRTVKTLIFILMIIIIMQSRVRVHSFMWIVAVSLGYWSVKGGLFFIISGGQYRFWGPEQSMIYDNNSLALALVMVLPIMNYLRLQSAHKYIRFGLAAGMLTTVISIVISYSRGGLLGLMAALGFLWLKSRAKLVTLMVLVPLLGAGIIFAPPQWHERMSSLENITEDPSFISRWEAWQVNFKYAVDHPFFGAGFNGTHSYQIFQRYLPTFTARRVAHSIYFQVLGDHGFVGLGIYLMIVLVAWRNANWIIRNTRKRPDLAWAHDLAAMLKVSLVAFLVAGAALSMSYYDTYFALVAMIAITRRQVGLALAGETKQPAPIGVPARTRTA